MRMIFDGRYKLVENRGVPEQLCDLEADPWELANLVSKEPERAQRMSEKLAEILASERSESRVL